MGVLRARRSEGKTRRAWLLLVIGRCRRHHGQRLGGRHRRRPGHLAEPFSDVTIAVALVISTLGLLTFPGSRRRGAELSMMFLDGLVAGGAFLLIASVLVYAELLNSSAREGTAAQVFALIFPVLDVVLATVAVLLVVRASGADRLMLVLVASAYLHVRRVRHRLRRADRPGGLPLRDGPRPRVDRRIPDPRPRRVRARPRRRRRPSRPGPGPSDALGTMLVFAILVSAAVVQTLFGRGGDLKEAQSALWVVMVMAAGVRQVLLNSDNARLRRGLEHQVEEQTARPAPPRSAERGAHHVGR